MPTRILIIDDDPNWIEFARSDLGIDFDVEVASNLEAILAEMEDNHYKLIIANSRCLNILEMLNEKYPEKRVVAATEQPTTREAINVFRLGVFDYFAKDLRYEIISQKIFEAIQKPIPAQFHAGR